MTTSHIRAGFAAFAGALCTTGALAAVGDTLTYTFDHAATGGATLGATQATLLLTETASGVNFLLTPNWGVTTGNRVDGLSFVYSGEALSYVDPVALPDASFATGLGQVDGSYSTTNLVTLLWPSSGAGRFDNDFASAAWSLNGATITLDDFTVLATTTSTKPSPAFGVISLPGAAPSKWVALGGERVSVVPEPESYAMLLAGLGIVGYMARRRRA